MSGPLMPEGPAISLAGLALAFGIGILFGFFLERAGLGNPRKLVGVFYGRDMAVLKVMFTAILTAMIGLQYLGLFGRLDLSQVGVLPTYLWPQVVGGLVFGVGFVVGGYCPGTALVALASGRRDALAFIAGIFVGTALWGPAFPTLRAFYTSGSMGPATLYGALGVTAGVTALLVALIALAAFRLATLVEAGHAETTGDREEAG